MPEPPSGTVTFLFTDIEGSTRLWEERPAEMRVALARHDEVLRAVVESVGGFVFSTSGDGFAAAFGRAGDAAAAALAAQRGLASVEWPPGLELPVRMGLHTGEAQERDGDYFGPVLNRAARVMAAAHGGQILCSRGTADLIRDAMPDEVALVDLGEHRLRDLTRREWVFQIDHPGLTREFPALRSVDAVPNNLPAQLTSFIGRERDITSVSTLLHSNRMVTLLGTGGCGKTRLSLQVAAHTLDRFPDGIWFVELAPIDDPDLTPQTVAEVIGLREQPGRAMADTLQVALAKCTTLLVLDNCEHVVAAAAALASALLSKCPGLSVLATTREQLGVPGEMTFTLPGLSVPGADEVIEGESIAAFDGVQLFVDRAVKARPDFVVTNGNSQAVAQICRRLDGIPLALELAAARTRVLSPEQICDGLADRFRLLTTGARTLLPRQQTLRASVDWSYALLSDDERTTLGRLSIFAGGFDFEAGEHVVADEAISKVDVLDLLGSLVDKSLVQTDDHSRAVRYRMLETIRQYGAERLKESGDQRDVARRHRDYYRAFVRRASAEEEGPDQAEWAARVRLELDNVRAALQSALHEDDDVALIELTCGAGNTWTLLGRSSEHRRWLEEAIAKAPADSPLRASALYQLGITDMFAGDMVSAASRLGASVPLYRSLGDEAGALWAHSEFAWSIAMTDGLAAARPLYDEGIGLARAAGAEGACFSMEYGLAQYLHWTGHLDEALARYEVLVRQPAPVEHFGHWAQLGLAMTTAMLGEVVVARPLVDQAIRYGQAFDDLIVLPCASCTLGWLRIWAGDVAGARAPLEESRRLVAGTGPFNSVWSHHGMGLLALAQDEPATALVAIEEVLQDTRSMSAAWATMLEVVKADALIAAGDLAGARELLDQTLRVAQVADAPAYRGGALIARARVARAEGGFDQCEDLLHEALAIARPMRHKIELVDALEVLGAIASDLDSHEEAARLLSAAEALRRACGYLFRAPTQQRDHSATLAVLRRAVKSSVLERARSEGAQLSWEEACDYAGRGRGERKRPSTGWQSLTPTEAKVVALVAEGLTNPQVGARLFISRHTVDSHLRHVYAKLGVSSRAELAAEVGRRDGADA
jgi:predicted ATPase/class 3 adenylate cyclase/DNA-binding CsgD family transcriptional regulator